MAKKHTGSTLVSCMHTKIGPYQHHAHKQDDKGAPVMQFEGKIVDGGGILLFKVRLDRPHNAIHADSLFIIWNKIDYY
jgi:hypothetical protein